MSVPDEEPRLGRRRFLGVCACALAGTALTSACASLALRRAVPVNGKLMLPLLQYPELTEAGGTLAVAPDGRIVGKEVLGGDLTFAEGEERVGWSEDLTLRLPSVTPDDGGDYTLYVGFQLDDVALARRRQPLLR